MSSPEASVSARVEGAILTIRGHRVLLDGDLAPMYGVSVRALNQAVKRNGLRFPEDFMFELTIEETKNLRSQTVISSSWGGPRYLPRALKYDTQFRVVFDAIRELMTPPIKPRRRIGFRAERSKE
jgi:hypothetical protein